MTEICLQRKHVYSPEDHFKYIHETEPVRNGKKITLQTGFTVHIYICTKAYSNWAGLVRFGIFRAVTMTTAVFWNVMLCILMQVYPQIRRSFCHRQGRRHIPEEQSFFQCCIPKPRQNISQVINTQGSCVHGLLYLRNRTSGDRAQN